MSLLTPLYLLGLLGVSLPILLHLIRRTPRGRQVFSSLMFLAPSPPRLTRRSRIDQWLLLLLRATALMLLALAFARPFLRQAAELSLDATRGRRVAILLDTSASMQRTEVWPRALDKIEQRLSQLDADDDVALFTFDTEVRTIVPFDDQIRFDRRGKPDLVRERLRELSPSWAATDIARALTTVADALAVESHRDELRPALQMVVVSDLQQGARLDALQTYEWPADVFVSVDVVQPRHATNASARLLVADEETNAGTTARVLIANANDSAAEQFQIRWAGAGSDAASEAVVVPPGQTRVIALPRPKVEAASDHLVLTGDEEAFDNQFWSVPVRQEVVPVQYAGLDRDDDPDGLLYYLRLALTDTPTRKVQLTTQAPDAFLISPVDPPRLVVVTAALPPAGFEVLDQYLRRGGTALMAPASAEAAAALTKFDSAIEHIASAATTREDGYLILADIDFAHPLFAPFSSPQFSDFTKIHFWNHQRFGVRDASAVQIVARFDNGDPALWEQAWGDGRLLVLTSGWHPDDSQLALSSKFVPFVNTLLDQAGPTRIDYPSFAVGDSVPLPGWNADFTVIKPDGAQVPLPAASESFRHTDVPGIYHVRSTDREFDFAVNLATAESDTAVWPVERLEQSGVLVGEHRTRTAEADRQRQLRDIELESRQQLWRWLIVAVLGVLGLETWLAARNSPHSKPTSGEHA